MGEVRNAISQALADGRYLKLDASNDPITENLNLQNIGVAGTSSTNTHMIIGSKVYSGSGTVIGIGCFPQFSPTSLAANTIVSLQGNVWFGTTNWLAGSGVRALDFFPAPVTSGVGSTFLDIVGINTGGMLNILGRTISANTITGIGVIPLANIFGGTDNTTANIVRGIYIASASATFGTWGRLTGLEIEPQTSGVINQALWLSGDGIGSDIVFGAGAGGNGDSRIYYDGSDLVIDPQILGNGGVRILNMKSGATVGAAGATTDELWKTNGHATLPNNVVMIG